MLSFVEAYHELNFKDIGLCMQCNTISRVINP